jgi:AsmA-like C-terminal region
LRDLVNSCWFAFKWGLVAALVAAAGVGFYFYTRLNDEIRQRVQARFAAAYPHLRVTVRAAQLLDGKGIEVRGLLISDPSLEGRQSELAYFDEMLLCCSTNWKELIGHEPKIERIIVRRPQIQSTRQADGSWTAVRLMPIPKFSDRSPDMLIEAGQVILVDGQRNPPTSFTVSNINMDIKPDAAAQADRGSTITGSLTADHLQQVEIKGQYDRAGHFDISGSAEGIDVSPELVQQLPAEHAARLALLAPLRAQANLQFHVWNDPASQQPFQFTVAGHLLSGRFDDPRLPQALADMQADFHADNQGCVLDRLTAKNGPMAVQLHAEMAGYQAGAPLLVEAEAEHLLIGPQWEALLPPKLLEQWRKFLPAGEINIDRGRARFDGNQWTLEGTVKCLNTSFTYYRFPYRLEHASGTLTLSHDAANAQNRLVLDLMGFAGGRQVKIDGEFFNPGPQFTGGVELRGENLPIDQNLYDAMRTTQPKPSEVVQSLNPAGTFNFWVRMERQDPNQPVISQHLIVTLNRCTVCYDKFRYPLYNVVGKLELIDGHWTFSELSASNHTGHITGEGRLTPVPDGFDLLLRFTGRDVVLEEELRDALSPKMQQLWNELRPRGNVHLNLAEVSYRTADRELNITTEIQPVPDTVSIDPTFFPYRLEKLQGTIRFREGRAEFKDMRAVHERTELGASGFCEYSPAGAWHLKFENLSIDRLHLDRDRDLIAALPAKLRKSVQQLNPTGLMGLSGSFEWWGNSAAGPTTGLPPPAAECKLRTAWNAQFDLQQVAVHAGLDLKNVTGGVRLTGECDGQQARSRGELNLDSLIWNNYQFTNVTGPLWLDDRQVILGSAADAAQQGHAPRHIAAKAYGGSLVADGWVGLEETPRYTAQVVVSNADLGRFCTEAVPGRQKLKGKVIAGVDLNGTAAGLHTLRGQGEIKLHDADVYELPVMVALLKVLNLRRPDTNAFTNSDIKFHLDGEHVLLDNIEFSGDAISLVGKGEMNLNSEIQLTLHSLVGRSDIQLPLLKNVMGNASEQIMQIHVTGTLADPKTRREAFPNVAKAFQSLQNGMQPADRTLLPESMRPPVEPPPLR